MLENKTNQPTNQIKKIVQTKPVDNGNSVTRLLTI